MKQAFWAACVLATLFTLAGCDEDKRNTEEKLSTPRPDVATRFVMACPKCGAPTSPFRVDDIKSYYRCSGLPPQFKYHEEKQWSRRVQREYEMGHGTEK